MPLTTVRRAAAGLALLALAACASQYRNHGYAPDESQLAEIVVGVDTRASVEETIGRPSSTGVLQESGWYYVASRVRRSGARAPEEVEREVVAISFDNDGVVSNVERYGLEDGRVVALSRRVTETNIGRITLIQQIIRNFGRIDIGEALTSDN
jgi:outer membrane protein assembly factor BamE (lipoprotein component of BamABCDE complex)